MTQGEIFKLRPLDKRLSLDNCRRDEMQVGIPPMMELWLRLRKERSSRDGEAQKSAGEIIRCKVEDNRLKDW